MINLGIHQFKINDHQCSYFIERMFGNYLIFSDYIRETNYDFLKSKGGLYKQFMESPTHIDEIHGKIFDKYGAYAVGDFLKEIFHAKLPVERYGIDYVDPDLRYISQGSAKKIFLTQMNKPIMILGSEFYLSSDDKIFLNNTDITEKLTQEIIQKKIEFTLFTRFECSSHLTLGQKSFLQKIYQVFKN